MESFSNNTSDQLDQEHAQEVKQTIIGVEMTLRGVAFALKLFWERLQNANEQDLQETLAFIWATCSQTQACADRLGEAADTMPLQPLPRTETTHLM